MNKTIIININGIVFHIEEDAYEVLRTYMTDVKRHFAYSKDSEEIVTDIENRLAEMFTERLQAENKQVIILQDVREVTALMGNVADFEQEEDGEPHFTAGGTGYKVEKKLMRDMDDRVIAGVCAGVGHYFDIEPRWIRLILLLLVFFGGTGIMLYIILWIVMPKALSRADRMAMRGEPINIQTFKKNFDEELEGLRHGFHRASSEAAPLIDRFARVAGRILMIAVKVVGAFIIFIGAMFLFALVVGLLAFLGVWQSSELNHFPFNIVNPEYKSVLSFSAFVIVFIPLVALILFAIRVLFNRSVVSRTGSFAMLIIWLAGIGLGVYYGSKVAGQFTDEATFSQVTEIQADSVYYLKLNPVKYLTKEDSMQYDIDRDDFKSKIIINDEEHDFDMPRNVRLRIEMSESGKATLNQEFSARGPNFESALKSAQSTNYKFLQQDSLLQFDWNTRIHKNQLWRDQRVDLTLRIPKNTRVLIDGNLNRYLEDHNLWDCQPENSPENSLSEWIMTDEGLKCKNDSLFRRKRGEFEEN
ncbi:PspC domain-containing protein [Flavihumibacter sp. R14]|nr:PspC domain-containing protein [Flavihumibacter soli]